MNQTTPRAKLPSIARLVTVLLAVSLLLAAVTALLAGGQRDPWETLPRTDHALARAIFEMDPICSGILGKDARFTEFTADRIAWTCATNPWGNRFEEEAICVEGDWVMRRFEWHGIPDMWQRAEGQQKGPSCQ